MRVMAAIEGGLDEADAAGIFEVSTESIGRWKVRREVGGAEALRSWKTGRKTGSGRLLSASEEAAVRQTTLDFTPDLRPRSRAYRPGHPGVPLKGGSS